MSVASPLRREACGSWLPVVAVVALLGAGQGSSLADVGEITGSRIERADASGSLPITLITRGDIDRSGRLSIADVLRYMTLNSAGSFAPHSGFAGGAQGSAAIDLRGLGSQRTLVLVDGRRVADAPGLGSDSHNLNVIPLAMVERIEVLRRGASPIYGSGAIGGVVNIVTRREGQGLSLSGTYTAPTHDGGEERYGSLAMGLASDRGRVLVSLDHYGKDIIDYRDREYLLDTDPSMIGFPGSFLRRDPVHGIPVGLWAADPRCPHSFDSDPVFPDSARQMFPGLGELCTYRSASTAGFTAAIERDSLHVGFDFEIGDLSSAFGRFRATRAEAFGREASIPTMFPRLIGATNPINPTLGELGPGQGYVLDLRYRLTPLGTRDRITTDNVSDNVFGFRGSVDLLGGANWELALLHSRYRQREIGYGYALISNFIDAVASGQFDPFAAFDPAAVAQFAHTVSNDNEFRRFGVDGRVDFDLVELTAGPVGFSAGFEYFDERFSAESDAQSNARNVFSSLGGATSGERARHALFVEMLVPIRDMLHAGLALRHDRYNDFGGKTSPGIHLDWRPLEALLLRGSWQQGFVAPSLLQLKREASVMEVALMVPCIIGPDGVCRSLPSTVRTGGNRDLKAETSRQHSIGAEWRSGDLVVAVDYHRTVIRDGIGQASLAQLLANERRCLTGDSPCVPSLRDHVVRDASGAISVVNVMPGNFTRLTTTAIDAGMRYGFDSEIGRFDFGLALSHIGTFELAELGVSERAGSAYFPKRRATASVVWRSGDFSAALHGTHIGSSCEEEVAGTTCDFRLGSWSVFDLGLVWQAPWHAELQVGARNIADRDPVLDRLGRFAPDLHNAPFLYDMQGRVPYVRYTQRF